ncbi:hypothetical protein [Microbacterium caowuchunii]|uniref:hypothetical protein n=1 Tax=Microbacterium caowuchunii TaxID=2614638 RepID=UPI001EE8F84B|nr:hypothetical protein [Microbacterium caowuchunii]
MTATAAAASIAASALAVRAAPRILVDGRSGSGKTTLATELVRRHPEFQIVALDDLYPGWDGLFAGSDRALEDVLTPHAEGRVGRWRRWDWDTEAYAEEHAVQPDRPLLVEGSGVLTARSAVLGDVCIWMDADADQRRMRALARDGATFEPHWERWARQEEEHLAAHDPLRWASAVVSLR